MNFIQQTLTVVIALATMVAGQGLARAASHDAAAPDPAALRSTSRSTAPWPSAIALAAPSLNRRDGATR